MEENRCSASEALLQVVHNPATEPQPRSDSFGGGYSLAEATEQPAQASVSPEEGIEAVFESLEPGVGFLFQEFLSGIACGVRDCLDDTDRFAIVGGEERKVRFISDQEVLFATPEAVQVFADQAAKALAEFRVRIPRKDSRFGLLKREDGPLPTNLRPLANTKEWPPHPGPLPLGGWIAGLLD